MRNKDIRKIREIQGIKNVVFKNFYRAARQGEYESEEQIHKDIDDCIRYLEENREKIIGLHRENLSCEHEFISPATFTVQGRLFGFVVVFERVCSKCGFKEYYTESKDQENPDWTKGAEERYYNNFI